VVSAHSVCPISVIEGIEPARAVSPICGYVFLSSVKTCTCVSTVTFSTFPDVQRFDPQELSCPRA